ncbi:hypothetical protein ACEQ8H_007475 [Pleosporales sp. CAS-2024a]
MEYLTPAVSVTSDMTDEELDKYFATYVPLSNLPTPPPAKEQAQAQQTTTSSRPGVGSCPETQVYAQHLARLVPGTHVHVICGFLERANLPDEVVAFAGCVLEGLSARFDEGWRDMVRPEEARTDVKTFLRTDECRAAHVSADVVVLGALALAHGYLSDRMRSSRHWSIKESAGLFSAQEIEATKRAMLQDTDYGLSRIKNEAVAKMVDRMQRRSMAAKKQDRRRTLSISLAGTAIWSHGVQTPEPSPC